MATYDCTDKGCVDVDLTQVRGGDHPTIGARIRAYGYPDDRDIWVDGQLVSGRRLPLPPATTASTSRRSSATGASTP